MKDLDIYNIVHDSYYSGSDANLYLLYKLRKKEGYGLGNSRSIERNVQRSVSERKYGIASYFALGLLDYDYDKALDYLKNFSKFNPYSCYVYAVIVSKKDVQAAIKIYKIAENMGSIPAKIKLLKHSNEKFYILFLTYLKLKSFLFLIRNGNDERIKSII